MPSHAKLHANMGYCHMAISVTKANSLGAMLSHPFKGHKYNLDARGKHEIACMCWLGAHVSNAKPKNPKYQDGSG